MVRITEELVRKRAEHNEGEIYTLEELSLHQQNIEKIENLDHWCRELKILYLQSNLISKIENVSRLKKLEYLNLALNNIEVIENLENCESLKKLDLTVNFVGILSSIDNLKDLDCFEELYLTGNPCQSFDGYREFVLASLPQLKSLDGTEVMKSERIAALQAYPRLVTHIAQQQDQWLEKRARERADATSRRQRRHQQQLDADSGDVADSEDAFWNEKTPFTPETRWETHEYLEEKKRREKNEPEAPPKPERRLFASDGRPYNVNEGKIEFSFTDDEAENRYVLDVVVYKHLDTSLLDCDVQPTYLRIIIKGKLLQLALPDEVRPDSSTATRSQTTGHLLVIMPKVRAIVTTDNRHQSRKASKPDTKSNINNSMKVAGHDDESSRPIDWRNIVSYDGESGSVLPRRPQVQSLYKSKSSIEVPPNSRDFVDDPTVPPLE